LKTRSSADADKPARRLYIRDAARYSTKDLEKCRDLETGITDNSRTKKTVPFNTSSISS